MVHDDRGILTAEAIAGLDLAGLELVVLSACETGLGLVGGGEGVFGLQRAFHLAGAQNVVASLWKVDDQATAALMALFYDRLWRQGKLPLEALRERSLRSIASRNWPGNSQRGGHPISTSMCSDPSQARVRTARRHLVTPRAAVGGVCVVRRRTMKADLWRKRYLAQKTMSPRHSGLYRCLMCQFGELCLYDSSSSWLPSS